MGGNPSKKLQRQIEQRYKCLKRYYDQFYGEVIVVKCLSNEQIYVRIDKTYQSSGKQIKKYLQQRSHESLVPLKQFYSFRMDLCSQAQTFILIFESNNHTLRQEILRRSQLLQAFSIEQYLQIAYSMTKFIVVYSKRDYRQMISTTTVQFKDSSHLEILEDFLKDSNPLVINSLCIIHKKMYLSPEVWLLVLRNQLQEASQLSTKQSSVVFMLGMNLLQILWLSDLFAIYNTEQNQLFDWQYLIKLVESVKKINEQIHWLIHKMLSRRQQERPSLDETKKYLKILAKTYKIEVYRPDISLQWNNLKQLF